MPRGALIVTLVAFATLLSAFGPVHGTSIVVPSERPTFQIPLPAVGPSVASPTPIQHLVIIPLENAEVTQIWTGAPYERYLSNTYANLTNYYGICHPSASNYLAMVSGSTFQCGTDAYNVYNTVNIADRLGSAGFTWASYSESIPNVCSTTNNGIYAQKHNPLVYMADIADNASVCDTHIIGSAAFNTSFAQGTITNYSFYVPNEIDDGHSSSLAIADAWLKAFLTPILNHTGVYASGAPSYEVNHTAFVITYDEGDTEAGYTSGATLPACEANYSLSQSTCGGHIYTVVASDYSKGLTVPMNACSYNLLSTTEWLFGLSSTGHNDSSYFPAFSGAFDFTAPPEYAVTGNVTSSEGGAPIVGAHVRTAGFSATTNSTGGYRLNLTNGSYKIVAGAAGYLQVSVSLNVSGGPVAQSFSLTLAPPPTNYTANFTVTGLPAHRSWKVTLNGSTETSSSSSIVLHGPVGQYGYLITGPSGYRVAGVAPSGMLRLEGTENFSLSLVRGATFAIEFHEIGLPIGSMWCVVVASTECSSRAVFKAGNLTPGAYAYAVPGRAGYTITTEIRGVPIPASGNLTLTTRGVVVVVRYLYPYPVTFTEQGLPPGTNWSVKVGPVQLASTGTTIVLQLSNGSYRFQLSPIAGYAHTVRPWPVKVRGHPASVNVTFRVAGGSVPFLSELTPQLPVGVARVEQLVIPALT